jgi:hypothetical protein
MLVSLLQRRNRDEAWRRRLRVDGLHRRLTESRRQQAEWRERLAAIERSWEDLLAWEKVAYDIGAQLQLIRAGCGG